MFNSCQTIAKLLPNYCGPHFTRPCSFLLFAILMDPPVWAHFTLYYDALPRRSSPVWAAVVGLVLFGELQTAGQMKSLEFVNVFLMSMWYQEWYDIWYQISQEYEILLMELQTSLVKEYHIYWYILSTCIQSKISPQSGDILPSSFKVWAVRWKGIRNWQTQRVVKWMAV